MLSHYTAKAAKSYLVEKGLLQTANQNETLEALFGEIDPESYTPNSAEFLIILGSELLQQAATAVSTGTPCAFHFSNLMLDAADDSIASLRSAMCGGVA